MNRSKNILAGLTALLLLGTWQEPANAQDMLRIQSMPAPEVDSLVMRIQAQSAGQAETIPAKESPQPNNDAVKATNYSALKYKAFPTTARDLRERVVFKTNIGYELESAALSGAAGINGVVPGDTVDGAGLGERRRYVLGDAVIGSRGVLLPSLSTYFLSRFRLDAGGAEYTASRRVYDAEDVSPVLIRAGYAELDGLGGQPGGVLDSIYVRAGRQYRRGASRFVSNFDGLTLSYDSGTTEVSGFVGQRVSLFFNDDPGVVAGLGLLWHGQKILNFPTDLGVDYLRFDPGGDAQEAREVVETKGRVRLAKDSRLYVTGRLINNGDGDGMGVDSMSARLRHSFGKRVLVIADLERNFARSMVFDYIGSSSVDVVNLGQELGLAFAAPQASTLAAARASYQISGTSEAHSFYRYKRADKPTDADSHSRSYQEIGAAATTKLLSELSLTGQYKYRRRDLEVTSMVDETNFAATSSAGLRQMHELSAYARYVFGRTGANASLGGYFRVSDFETAYYAVESDGVAGGRFQVRYSVTDFAGLRAEGELAQPSEALSPDMDTLYSLRLMMEARY